MKGSAVHPAVLLLLSFTAIWHSGRGCSPNPCLNSGICSGNIFSFTCNCVAGYTGTICETNLDECLADSCSNRGACIDGVNGFSCLCQDGCTGTTCNSCANPPEDPSCNPCDNGGTEVGDVCYCASGFTGDTCSNVTCEEPPAFPFSTETSTGSLVGDTATYACQSGFDQCVDPAVVTCQASGSWTSLSNVCDRSTYTNLLTNTFYPTPCQPSSYLRLEMTVFFTGESNLQVRRGSDYLYIVEFRRIYRYWYTFFSTYIGGNYRYVWYYGLPFSFNTSNQVTITLVNGNYIFESNGNVITRADISGTTPQAFRFSGSIGVTSLQMFHSP